MDNRVFGWVFRSNPNHSAADAVLKVNIRQRSKLHFEPEARCVYGTVPLHQKGIGDTVRAQVFKWHDAVHQHIQELTALLGILRRLQYVLFLASRLYTAWMGIRWVLYRFYSTFYLLGVFKLHVPCLAVKFEKARVDWAWNPSRLGLWLRLLRQLLVGRTSMAHFCHSGLSSRRLLLFCGLLRTNAVVGASKT